MCTCINRNFILFILYSSFFYKVTNGIVNIAVCSLGHCERLDVSPGTDLYYYCKHYGEVSLSEHLVLQNLILISITL